ncbi:unnamed protein product, partial [marine sediment metagenome]
GARMTPWGWNFKGASRTKELHDLLVTSVMSRRKKREVLADLPKLTRSMIPLPIRKPHEYKLAADNLIEWIARTDEKKAERLSKARQMVEMGELLRLSARLKFRYVVDWINTFLEDTDEKLLVFGIHKKMIRALNRRCNSEAVIIDGSVTGKARYDAVVRFQNDTKVRLLLGNIKAAGTGVDGIQKACSTAAFVELPWQPGAVVQAIGRLDRIGQTKPVQAYFLVAHDTVEEKLCALLQKKEEIISNVLDGSNTGGMSLFDELMTK